jgi:uncharacterized caspase-like protein
MRTSNAAQCLLVALAAGASILPAQSRQIAPITGAHKLALVIGNDNYAGKPLANGVHDAQAMRAALAEVGFTVDVQLNVTMAQMEQAAERFVGRVRPGDIALYYYSGHGIQVGDQNYLIPVDFDAHTAVDAKYKSYAAARMQENLEAAGAGLQIIILDACRDNPYRTLRGAGGGLAAMQAGKGTYIAFATAPGKTADDNARGSNGLFTGELVNILRQPGLTLDQVFNRVRQEVSSRRPEQVPWSTSSVVGEFYFRPPAASPAPANEAELEYWRSIRDTNSVELFEAYLRRFPKGQFVEIAQARIRQVSALRTVAPSAPSVPPVFQAFIGTWSERWSDVNYKDDLHIAWVGDTPKVTIERSNSKTIVSSEKFASGILTFHKRNDDVGNNWEFDYTVTVKSKDRLSLKVFRIHDNKTFTGELYR